MALARVEVADRAAEEGDQPRRRRRAGSAPGRCSKSQTRPWTSRPGYSSTRLAAVCVGDLLGDVDRDVGVEAAGVAHRAQQVAGLRRRAGAELDQGAGRAGGGEDLGRALGEDLPLGPGRVVLGQLGDPLEQLRAALVVEVFRRQLLRVGAEAGADVARHRRAAASASRWTSIAIVMRPSRSAGRRRSGGAAAGPSCGSWAGRRRGWVAQEPPRSTL